MKTDLQLKLDIIAELGWEPAVNAAQIGVEVKDGVVILAGHVNSYAEKWQAERAAQRVNGVKALAIEMDVQLPSDSERSDADIARSAQNVLEWSSFLPRDAVKVMSENGWLTLTGVVHWKYQKRAAENAVRNLMGVKGVSDQITIKPKLTLSAVKSEIEAALQRRARSSSPQIMVAVNGSDVTLSGTVHSWAERDLATHSAWGTPGVSNVTDNITIAS